MDVLAKQNITTPTSIQNQAIPIMLEGGDIIGQAHTGSGPLTGVPSAPPRCHVS